MPNLNFFELINENNNNQRYVNMSRTHKRVIYVALSHPFFQKGPSCGTFFACALSRLYMTKLQAVVTLKGEKNFQH